MIQEGHARKFFLAEGERKTFEVRSKPVKCLEDGDRVALISVSPQRKHTIVAILRFEGNVKIPLASFAKFFPLHRVTDKELKDIFGAEITQTHLWGWHLDVVETFEPGFPLKVKMGPVVWRYFTLEDIEDSDSQQD